MDAKTQNPQISNLCAGILLDNIIGHLSQTENLNGNYHLTTLQAAIGSIIH